MPTAEAPPTPCADPAEQTSFTLPIGTDPALEHVAVLVDLGDGAALVPAGHVTESVRTPDGVACTVTWSDTALGRGVARLVAAIEDAGRAPEFHTREDGPETVVVLVVRRS